MTTKVKFATVYRELLLMSTTLLLAFLLAACGERKDAAATPSPQQAAAHVEHAAAVDHVDHATEPAAAEHAAADHAASDHAASDHDVAAHAAQDAHADHATHPETLAADELPGTSLFHLTGAFTAQDGTEFRLVDLSGNPTVVVMFYGDCTTACPLLVKSAQDIEAALSPEVADRTQFLMVSFDTARDTPDKLRAYADEKGLDKNRWHWLVGSPLLTRQLATLLGVQFRDAGNGVFAHSNLVTVLDSAGVPTARLEGLGVALDPALAAIQAAID